MEPRLVMNKVSADDKDLLSGFISPLYHAAFPPNERRAWSELLQKLTDESAFNLYSIDRAGQPVGFLSLWQLDEDLVYGEHFAISSEIRSQGVGSKLLHLLKTELGDATFVFEVELPTDDTQDLASRRVAFYQRHGFSVLPFAYEQPPYHQGDKPFPMRIMANRPTITSSEFADIVRKLHQKVYNCPMD